MGLVLFTLVGLVRLLTPRTGPGETPPPVSQCSLPLRGAPSRMRPRNRMQAPTTTTTEPRQDRGLAVIYALFELVVVPVGLMLLVLSFVPGDRAPAAPPANAQKLPAPTEPPALLLADPGRPSGPRHPVVR